MSTTKRKVENDADIEKRPAGLSWLIRLVILLLVIFLCLISGFLGLSLWQEAELGDISITGGSSGNLSPVERLYLRNYLSSRSEDLSRPIGSGDQPLQFDIEPGETADQIASNLSSFGLLDNEYLFRNYLRYYGIDSQLEAGRYSIDPNWTIPELAAALMQAIPQEVPLRFFEGWRMEEMVEFLGRLRPANIDSGAFQGIINRRIPFDLSAFDFLNSLPPDQSLEGFLFPDTYLVPVDADAALLVTMMLENFDRQVSPGLRQSFGAQGLSLSEAVTLASIIQREAVVADERPLMAGVFLNRIRQGIPLQADPTVQYAIGYQDDDGTWWKSPLTMSDLRNDSPYNTYVHEGFPPGPISNPGIEALEAVAYPVETDYMFFVVDCEAEIPGSHIFSNTFEEHLVNVENCR